MAEYKVGYGKPPVSGNFKSVDPRRGVKPKGATSFATYVRNFIESETFTTKDGKQLSLKEIALKDAGKTMLNPNATPQEKIAARNFLFNYGYGKPTENINFNDVTEPLKDEDRKESIRLRMLALQKGETETVNEAEKILTNI